MAQIVSRQAVRAHTNKTHWWSQTTRLEHIQRQTSPATKQGSTRIQHRLNSSCEKNQAKTTRARIADTQTKSKNSRFLRTSDDVMELYLRLRSSTSSPPLFKNAFCFFTACQAKHVVPITSNLKGLGLRRCDGTQQGRLRQLYALSTTGSTCT